MAGQALAAEGLPGSSCGGQEAWSAVRLAAAALPALPAARSAAAR
jgi:hypothetical protein